MSRKTFLTIVAVVAFSVGLFCLLAPMTLLVSVKMAAPNAAAAVMARTAGVLLVTLGVLNFLVRAHHDSPTLRAILIANLVSQLAILPVDPMAYAQGTFHTLGSFVPNTILHILLSAGFIFFIVRMKTPSPAPAT